jgi:hypothetical protein
MITLSGGISMFREMRRKDREIKNDEAVEILKNSDYGILSTISQNGYPYGVPISYSYINGSIYFHCAAEGHKLDNIKNNDKVSFCAVGQNRTLPDKFSVKYESVIVFGRAIEVFDDEKNMALLEILNKYSPDFTKQRLEYIKKSNEDTKVIRINVEHISGKARKQTQ